MRVGDIIHKLRKERKMTLLELSGKSGVALATLSRVENNKMTGTLDSHIAICKAFDLNLPDLYKDLSTSKKTIELHPKSAKTDIFMYDKKTSSEVLASNFMNKKMMPILIKIGKSGRTHSEETRAGVEKFIFVLYGKIEATIGENKYNMVKGDTLYFESSFPHHFKNMGNGEARIISVVSPPVL